MDGQEIIIGTSYNRVCSQSLFRNRVYLIHAKPEDAKKHGRYRHWQDGMQEPPTANRGIFSSVAAHHLMRLPKSMRASALVCFTSTVHVLLVLQSGFKLATAGHSV